MDENNKTYVLKILKENKIEFKITICKNPCYTCEDVVRERKVPLEMIVKCILLKDKENNFILTCLQANKKVDTDKVRKLFGLKRLTFASEEEIREITGYEKGAISPIVSNKNLRIVFDKEILNLEKVSISGGNNYIGVEIKVEDLVKIVNPLIAEISKNT